MQLLRLLSSFLVLCCLFTAAPALSAEVLIVQGVRDASFTDVLRGFGSGCSAASRTVVLSDYVEVDMVRLVREEQPSVIVTLGDSALAAVAKIRQVPVVSLMSLKLSMGKSAPANVTGIGMVASPDQYFRLFNTLRLKRVGVLYDLKRSAGYVNHARQAASRSGIDLVALEVRDPADVPRQLKSLEERVDGIWLLPDITALTPATAGLYFSFSKEQSKPVIAFSGAYLAKGAAAVLEIDPYQVGKEGGELVNRLLSGATPGEVSFRESSAFTLKLDEGALGKLGINYDQQRLR